MQQLAAGRTAGLETSTSKGLLPLPARLPAAHHRASRQLAVRSASPSSTVTTQEGQGKALTLSTTTIEGQGPGTSDASLDSVKSFLQGELASIFDTGKLTSSRYADNFKFQDPAFKQDSLRSFQNNLGLLRGLFNIKFDVHRIEVQKPAEIVTRWTMDLQSKLLPWRPHVIVTGRSFYTVDAASGKLTAQRDTWDAVSDNEYLSVEGLAYIFQSLTNPQTTPNLEQPRYTVLKKAAEYEVRQYSPFLVAETSMPRSGGPADGTGFNDLAGFIFGGNNRNVSMEMTTPVITNAGQEGADNPSMQFVMEERYGSDAEALPAPNDARVTRRQEQGGIVAALSFSGLPLDFEVTSAERRLRAALLLDGLKPKPGYRLARYNDPFTLPFLRRNEILILLDDFELD